MMRMTLIGAALAAALLARPAAPADLAVYKGAGCEGRPRLADFEAWLGRPVDRVVDFLARDSWDSILRSARWVSGCWRDTPYALVLSIPMLPDKTCATLAEGARGAYNEHFRAIAERLVADGHGRAVLRIGWEFNGGWYPWAAKRDPGAWVGMWRQIVTTMRAVPGANFLFDWNPTLGWQQIPADRVYPGDDYVDVIGLDTYNQTWNRAADTPERRWADLMNQPYGLKWHAGFARARGKPMSFAEWGTGTRPDGHGGGDDPLYIRNMADWIHRHPVLYHGYWDYPAADFHARLSAGRFPLAGAELRRQFGPARPDRSPANTPAGGVPSGR